MNDTLTPERVARLIEVRRHLHAHPELSFEEHATADYLALRLEERGVTRIERVAGTGLVATIEGARPGPTLAMRGDIDALPITEQSEAPYCSANHGVMHACGHDVHATLTLGVAEQLAARREELCGTLRCLFQPAEEAAPRENEAIGAERMVEEGALKGVDAIFAYHCMPTLDVGRIGYTNGPVWAGSDLIEIVIHGQKTHAAYPHSGRDAIVAASHVVVALQTVTSRHLDAREPCVVSFGRMEAGESYNIIADTARLTGIVRALDERVAARAIEEIERIAFGVASSLGARAEVRVTPGSRPTRNDPALEARCVAAMRRLIGAEALVAHLPQMGAEDFAAFSRRVPGCYLFLGVRNEARGITHMIHTPRFDVDEACIELGVRAMSGALLELAATWPA